MQSKGADQPPMQFGVLPLIPPVSPAITAPPTIPASRCLHPQPPYAPQSPLPLFPPSASRGWPRLSSRCLHPQPGWPRHHPLHEEEGGGSDAGGGSISIRSASKGWGGQWSGGGHLCSWSACFIFEEDGEREVGGGDREVPSSLSIWSIGMVPCISTDDRRSSCFTCRSNLLLADTDCLSRPHAAKPAHLCGRGLHVSPARH